MVSKCFCVCVVKNTALNLQFKPFLSEYSVKCIYIVAQQISTTFSSCNTETLYSPNTNLLCPSPFHCMDISHFLYLFIC